MPDNIKLPEGILKSDFKRVIPYIPSKKGAEVKHLYEFDFEIWYTERFGWCIPTLTIQGVSSRIRARRPDAVRRTYGVAIKDGQQVRMGLGPHIKEHHQVYVTEANVDRLQKYIDLAHTGEAKAQETRDVISTRRLRSSMRRQQLEGGRWDS